MDGGPPYSKLSLEAAWYWIQGRDVPNVSASLISMSISTRDGGSVLFLPIPILHFLVQPIPIPSSKTFIFCVFINIFSTIFHQMT